MNCVRASRIVSFGSRVSARRRLPSFHSMVSPSRTSPARSPSGQQPCLLLRPTVVDRLLTGFYRPRVLSSRDECLLAREFCRWAVSLTVRVVCVAASLAPGPQRTGQRPRRVVRRPGGRARQNPRARTNAPRPYAPNPAQFRPTVYYVRSVKPQSGCWPAGRGRRVMGRRLRRRRGRVPAARGRASRFR